MRYQLGRLRSIAALLPDSAVDWEALAQHGKLTPDEGVAIALDAAESGR